MQEGQDKRNNAASNRLWLIISLVVAVTLVAVLLVPDKDEQAEDIPQVPKAPASVPGVQQVTDTLATDAPDELPEGEAARAYLAKMTPEGGNVAELFAQAEIFQAEGKLADAWLLYFKAAKEGSAEAAMALAEQADPAYFKTGASVLSQPDLVQAHKWYKLAERNGSKVAQRRLEALLKRLDKAAAAGDEQAAVLLETWK